MLRETWINRFGPLRAERIVAECRYSVVEVRGLEFAYSDYEGYTRALRAAWGAGYVPRPMGSALGSQLQEAVPNLVAVDAELDVLQALDSSRAS